MPRPEVAPRSLAESRRILLSHFGVVTAVIAVGLQAGELVSFDSPWTYRVLDDASVEVEDAWRQPEFDDSAWSVGPGGFRTGGLTVYDSTQVVAPIEPWVTACFRARFTLEQTNAFNWLILRADYEDGLVVFLNGSEVARLALPDTDAIARNTFALTPGYKSGETILLDIPPETLVVGTNVLVAEVHKSSLEDTTAAFKAELLTDFQRGPILQNLSSNRVTITWQTPLPTDASVRYGPTQPPTEAVTRAELQTNHVITLTDLLPATAYYYQIESGTDGKLARSPEFEFRTLQTTGPVNFVVIGDSGSGGRYQLRIRDLLRAQPGDFVLNTGDVVYHSFQEQWVDLRHFSVYHDDLTRRPFFTVFGNHDLYAGDQAYLTAFELPTNSVTGTEHFYSFDHGDVHFTALFLTQRAQATLWPGYRMEEGSPQYQWLTNDLATTSKPWKIVLGHVPLASSGGRRSDSYDGLRDQLEYQRILLPMFERYGVQLYFAGHDHNYERLGPLQGVHCVVSGGGGGYYLYGLSERDSASAQFFPRYHLVRVSVDGALLSAEALDDTGRVIDRFAIHRAPPASPLSTVNWYTPLPPTGADDGDGNRIGQVFDLPSPGIGAVSGRNANLGELHVAADADFLHVGLRDIMLPRSQSLILFLAVPGVQGVSSLQGLGDGLAEPEAEGVEALDALESLRFETFEPAIACVLGDEYGDGQFRTYPLADAGVDAGQGVFWLRDGFPEVTGAEVQQFDRSPQTAVVPEERRADFCIISLPRSAIGPFASGAVVQIGAVAAHAGATLDGSGFIAEIDTGYLGTDLRTGATDERILKPLTIPLPEDPDADADGLTASQELKHGTDPADPDSDGDTLLDGWEVSNNLDPIDASGPNGADGDPDADNFTNRQEQLAGTNPQDPTSALRLTIRKSQDIGYELLWEGLAGRTYSLEVASDAAGPFTTYEGQNWPREGADQQEVQSVSTDEETLYYRLQAVRP